MPVYPRWRGEHNKPGVSPYDRSGLSPLARGTLVANEAISNQFRFIPASAGNTGNWKTKSWLSPVYPRWRGEHNTRRAVGLTTAGLSPLARGTRHRSNPVRRHERFIPAGAGNTFRRDSPLLLDTVYPRWRGEHSQNGTSRNIQTGLSQLARGTQLAEREQAFARRFIPAGAGNTRH